MTTDTLTNDSPQYAFNVPDESPSFRFHFQGDTDPVLTLTKDGFTYLGQTITDAGEAYRLWTEAMRKVTYG